MGVNRPRPGGRYRLSVHAHAGRARNHTNDPEIRCFDNLSSGDESRLEVQTNTDLPASFRKAGGCWNGHWTALAARYPAGPLRATPVPWRLDPIVPHPAAVRAAIAVSIREPAGCRLAPLWSPPGLAAPASQRSLRRAVSATQGSRNVGVSLPRRDWSAREGTSLRSGAPGNPLRSNLSITFTHSNLLRRF